MACYENEREGAAWISRERGVTLSLHLANGFDV